MKLQGRIKELVALSGYITIAMLQSSYLIMPQSGIISVDYNLGHGAGVSSDSKSL